MMAVEIAIAAFVVSVTIPLSRLVNYESRESLRALPSCVLVNMSWCSTRRSLGRFPQNS